MINTNMSLFPISDIDYHFINICTPDILLKLSKVNWYYKNLTYSKLFPFREFFSKQHFQTNEKIDDMNFVQACYYGNIDVLKYVTKSIISQSDLDMGFQFACMRNNLEIAKYLVANYAINIHDDNDYAFRWSCRNHCFDTAFWLLDKYTINKADEHLPLLYNKTCLEMKHLQYPNIKSINVNWDDICLSQLLVKNFDVAKYIGITFNVDFIWIYKRIVKFTDIDIDANDRRDIAIMKIIDGLNKASPYLGKLIC